MGGSPPLLSSLWECRWRERGPLRVQLATHPPPRQLLPSAAARAEQSWRERHRWHTATALGVSLGGVGRCTLLVGDLAALHDLNALASIRKASPPLTIVVLNNQGGGIFRFLPIASHADVYSPYFDTPHAHSFGECCAGFGLPYCAARTRGEFVSAIESARRDGGPYVIEVPTDKEVGHAEAKALRESAHGAANALLQLLSATGPA